MLSSNVSERVKLLIAFAVAGMLFSFTITLSTNLIAGMLGVSFPSSVGGIVSQMITGNPMAILFAFITTAIFGVLIWILGFVGLKVKNKISSGSSPHLSARPKILAFFIIGALGLALFGIVDEAIAPFGVSSDVMALAEDAQALNVVGILVKIVAFAVYGALAIWLGTHFSMAEKILPSQLKKY